MQKRQTVAAIAAFCLLMAWLSPVGYAEPEAGAGRQGINLNTATVDELVQLPRVGRAVAERIVKYREDHGPFKRPEDLLAVRGIGEKTLERLLPDLRVE